MEEYYPAEALHQNYYNENTDQGYCRAIIKPKIGKLKDLFKDYIDPSKLWKMMFKFVSFVSILSVEWTKF